MHRRSGQQLKGSGQGAVASGQFLLLAFGEGSVFYRPLITDHFASQAYFHGDGGITNDTVSSP